MEVIAKIDKKAPDHVRYRNEILFLENGNCLDSCAENLKRILINEKISHNCLYDISDLPWDYIKNQIDWHNVIAFQTTGTYEITHTIRDYLFQIKEKKTIIQCYIGEPMFYYQPEGLIHDIWVLQSWNDDMNDWEYCKKLHPTKAIWDD